ncbi:PAP2 superfamily protein [Paenibacillus cellulosilyticus]|uniref:PAP2 superfamily protein n=1 Tax=Paenibacillus cellulosilyticus TaxID=375489 RepID=A0A2V2YR60_9BACL|nr:phosphatase PAP2 family protein [Paenibacillus cellulosilyticus]PWV99370.1 PAP2 superfamily protein [Paenibacillus cellulosilyticus]QKS45134.1 phosphatase PAP2 family protein [Paenibacillus cellulosilyticus]
MDFMLDILKWIQTIRTTFLTEVFTSITILAEEYVAIAVFCIVFWCLNKKWGYRIGFAYLLSGVTNNAIKEVFQVERPFVRDNELVPIRVETATGYSFPSGHTQGISALSTALATIIRKKWFTALSIILVLLVAFSRMYLGVHTIADVSVGAIFGFVCVIDANWMFDYVEKKQKAEWLLFLFIPIALGLIWLPSDDYIKAAGTIISFLIGYVLDQKYIKYEAKSPIGKQIIKFVVGMTILIGIKILGQKLLGETMVADFIRYFLIGAWMTIGAPLLFRAMPSRK